MARHILLLVASCLLSSVAAAEEASQPTPAQKAATLYETAMSQYRAGQRANAFNMLKQFVQMYPTNERVPEVYMLMAGDYRKAKKNDLCQENLDPVAQKFFPSEHWWKAQAMRMDLALERKDADGYLAVLEEVVAMAGMIPLSWWRCEAGANPDVFVHRYDGYRPWQAYLGQMGSGRGWLATLVRTCDTPQRAQRALTLLAPTLKIYEKQLSADWQYNLVVLMRKAGRKDEADAKLQEFIEQWGEQPPGMRLWLFQLEDAIAAKDAAAIEKIDQALVDRYGGSATLAGRIWTRLADLAKAGQYDAFVTLAGYYLKIYCPNPKWNTGVFGLYVGLAQPAGADKKDYARIQAALDLLAAAPAEGDPGYKLWLLQQRIALLQRIPGKGEEVYSLAAGFTSDYPCPYWQRELLAWKIGVCNSVGKIDEGVKLAEDLISEKYWCGEIFARLVAYARQHPSYAALVTKAREKYGVPEEQPTSLEAQKLKSLREHLRQAEVRHAEEIAQDLMTSQPKHSATIEVARTMVEYYRAKVLRKQRDEWVERMVKDFPYHPATESVMRSQIKTLAAEQEKDKSKSLQDLVRERFPGSFMVPADYEAAYEASLSAAATPEARVDLARQRYGARADAGDIDAMEEIAQYYYRAVLTETKDEPEAKRKKGEVQTYSLDTQKLGEFWMGYAQKLAGTRAETFCLCRAYKAYVGDNSGDGQSYSVPEQIVARPWRGEGALAAIKALQAQALDLEVRWKVGLVDVNILARMGKGKEAADTLRKKLKPGKHKYLAARLYVPSLGAELIKAGAGEDLKAVIDRLQSACCMDFDIEALALLKAGAEEEAKNYPAAAKCYLDVLHNSRFPLTEYWWLQQGLAELAKAKSPQYAVELEQFLKRIGNAQDLVPDMLYKLGTSYASAKNTAGASRMRDRLKKEYPDSTAHDKMEQLLTGSGKPRGAK